MFWFIVLLLFVGAGFYFYQKMMAIEREIRVEQGADNEPVVPVQEREMQSEVMNQSTVFDPDSSLVSVESEMTDSTSTEDTILVKVTEQPGIKQTELYPLFADTNKKQLQQSIKKMADDGILRREKQGSSYLLYPV